MNCLKLFFFAIAKKLRTLPDFLKSLNDDLAIFFAALNIIASSSRRVNLYSKQYVFWAFSNNTIHNRPEKLI